MNEPRATATRPPFPAAVSASSRASFVRCPHKFYRSKVMGLRPNESGVHLVFGAAMAAGLHAARIAFYRDGARGDEVIERGARALVDEWGSLEPYPDGPGSIPNKSLEACLACLVVYIEREWPLETDFLQPVRLQDGEPAVECRFQVPIPGTLHPQTDEPVGYRLRFDAIVQRDDARLGLDDKTTGSLRGDWARKWKLRGQFTGYRWAMRQLGFPLQGMIVRGLCPLKTQVQAAETLIAEPEWMLDRFEWQLRRDVLRMIEHWREGVWDYALDEACTDYSGCEFLPLCESRNPAEWIDTLYSVRVEPPWWDPN